MNGNVRKIDFLVGFICVGWVFMFVSAWALLFVPWQLHRSVGGWLLLAVYHVIYYHCVVCYRMAIVEDPGQVPPHWIDPSASEEELTKAKLEARTDRLSPPPAMLLGRHERIRYCGRCRQYKPPRSHHCRHCNVCVLKMDHHCPYINNCVGYRNQKAFGLFLLYTWTGSLYCFALYVVRMVFIVNSLPKPVRSACASPLFLHRWHVQPRAYDNVAVVADDVSMMSPAERQYAVAQLLLIVVNFIILLIVLFGALRAARAVHDWWRDLTGVGALGMYQAKIMLKNVTTVEQKAYRWAKYDAKEAGEQFHWMFDLGWRANLQAIYGEWSLNALRPSIVSGDGLSFPQLCQNA